MKKIYILEVFTDLIILLLMCFPFYFLCIAPILLITSNVYFIYKQESKFVLWRLLVVDIILFIGYKTNIYFVDIKNTTTETDYVSYSILAIPFIVSIIFSLFIFLAFQVLILISTNSFTFNSKFIITFSGICICLIVIIVWFVFIPSNFNMTLDNDTGYYSGYNLGNIAPMSEHYLSFNNGKLIVNNFNYTTTDIYSNNTKETIKSTECSQVIGDNIVYIDNDTLHHENTTTKELSKISDLCDSFIFDGKFIVYAVATNLYITTIDNPQKIKSVEYNKDNDIYYYQLKDNKLYTVISGPLDYIRPFYYYIYDINTMDEIASCSASMSGLPEDIAICNDSFIFHHDESSSIFQVDFKNNNLIKLLEHEDIVDLTSNGEKVYFVAEKSKWELITFTIDAETNGLWEFDITTGNVKKISEQCVIDDLLATDNYVYCYTIDYILPRGFTESWGVIGYKLKQIPIN